MPQAASISELQTTIAVELDQTTWSDYLDSVGRWLDNVTLLQAAFAVEAEDVQGKVAEPHMKQLLARIAQTAREHQRRAEELYALIHHDASRARRAMGTLVGKAKALQADVVGGAGGASAPWRDMHQLYLGGHNALSAFAAAEQLGYALGLSSFANKCFDVVAEKHRDQLILQELLLEMAPWAILYKVAF
jgi:hypothetical protein